MKEESSSFVEIQKVNNTSSTIMVMLIGYAFSMLFNEIRFSHSNNLDFIEIGALGNLATFGVFLVLNHKSLDTRLKALPVIGITMLTVLVWFLRAGEEVTRDLFSLKIFPQTALIVISSLKWVFCAQILALIFDSCFVDRELKNLKATNDEFIFVETLILILAAYYLIRESKDMTVILTVLLGYVLIKILTILQTKVLKVRKEG